MAHTYNLATDIGKVRLNIGDTDITPTTDAQFSDEELQVFLDASGGSVPIASAMALEAWATTLARNETSEKIGDYSYSKKDVENMLKLAERLRNSAATSPAMTWAEFNNTGVLE